MALSRGHWRLQRMEDNYRRCFLLLFSLLNPTVMGRCLVELMRGLSASAKALLGSCLISAGTFILFAWQGKVFFRDYLQVGLAFFHIFSGILVLLIGVRSALHRTNALNEVMKGSPEAITGSTAMPIMSGTAA